MKNIESSYQDEQNDISEESLAPTKWKTLTKVQNIIKEVEKTDREKSGNPDQLLKRIPQSLDEKGEILSKKDKKRANNLLFKIIKIIKKIKKEGITQYNQETEEDISNLLGESAWSCFADDGK